MPYLKNKLFTDPKIDYPIYDLNLNFLDYISQCRNSIAHTRVDLDRGTSEQIIEANSPFELRPHHQTHPIKKGALLIHGLLDSPFEMRDIGHQLQSQGLLVRAILLPGHGTIPGALLNIDYQQWEQTVRYGIATLAKEVEQIYIVGFSTGGTLALTFALHNPEKIAGIILLTPAFKIYSPFIFAVNWHKAISWAWKRAEWFHLDKNETRDYAKYSSLPFNAIAQVQTLIQKIYHDKMPAQAEFPLFLALNQHDETVCSHASMDYFHQHLHPQSRMILYTNKSLPNEDMRITIRPTRYPHLHIIDFSHLSIPIAPTNPHYGEMGDYSFSHCHKNIKITFGEFSSFEMNINKLLIKLNLTHSYYERLTFNPDFLFLMNEINYFIKCHPPEG